MAGTTLWRQVTSRTGLVVAAELANRPAFLPQTLTFSGQTVLWPRNPPQERYNSMEPVPKKQIPVEKELVEREAASEARMKDARESNPQAGNSGARGKRRLALAAPGPAVKGSPGMMWMTRVFGPSHALSREKI